MARPALCIQPRDGKLFVFMPPVEYVPDYLDLVAAIEDTAAHLSMPVILEGIDAVPFFFDHALHAGDLAGYPFDSGKDFFADLILHKQIHIPCKGICKGKFKPSAARCVVARRSDP